MDKHLGLHEPVAAGAGPALIAELLASLPDPVIGCDASGRIVYWSPAARQAYGFADEEAIGTRVALLLRTRYPRPALEILDELRDLGTWEGRLVQIARDGREVAVESRWAARRHPDGDLAGFVLVERPLASTAHLGGGASPDEEPAYPVDGGLRQAERLDSLGQLAGGVAHDFNNALAIIINYAAFVSGQVESLRLAPTNAQREEMRQDLGEVRAAAERAAGLTHQLLAFARQEVGAPQPISLNSCVQEIVPLITRTVGEHITTETRLAPDLHQIDADAAQIQQVLVNLAVNARDAMPSGGTLTIETANSELDQPAVSANRHLTPGSYVRLRVSDTGTGMTAEVLERVFDPFFTTKPRGHGTGLGLSSVYGIVTQAGGQARFYSEPGVGTSFVAVFPARPPVGAATVTASPEISRGATRPGATVLVVEDDRPLRAIIQRILADAGYVVMAADGPEQAVQLAAAGQGRIDLLLADLVMPGMLGHVLADRLLELQPEIEVLYMSGFSDVVLRQAAPVDPAALVEKPFTGPALLSRVARALAPAQAQR